jgi:hypothetical protein
MFRFAAQKPSERKHSAASRSVVRRAGKAINAALFSAIIICAASPDASRGAPPTAKNVDASNPQSAAYKQKLLTDFDADHDGKLNATERMAAKRAQKQQKTAEAAAVVANAQAAPPQVNGFQNAQQNPAANQANGMGGQQGIGGMGGGMGGQGMMQGMGMQGMGGQAMGGQAMGGQGMNCQNNGMGGQGMHASMGMGGGPGMGGHMGHRH